MKVIELDSNGQIVISDLNLYAILNPVEKSSFSKHCSRRACVRQVENQKLRS